ncbi:LAMI_0F14466g1_1 [Lachancea mirantina]|uniref:LAMI_0F14466g1_1 n=1 Tax=Lachancea mirantina TaxID=1230905 RepID=A0A1G4K465_9SACH|nr:LAMI_0F14466g1_1 [Lachancea mirantina]
MNSDNSEFDVENETYEETPDYFIEEPEALEALEPEEIEEQDEAEEPEEDDDYRYVPEFEDDETVQGRRGERNRRTPVREESRDRGIRASRKRQSEVNGRGNGKQGKPGFGGGSRDVDEVEEAYKGTGRGIIAELMDGTSRRKDKLTEEEQQLRRAENARKRKNLSEKKLEEEKQDVINKLLRRRAGKSRSNVTIEKETSEDPSAFTKPRRVYNSTGMVRLMRTKGEDLYSFY